ncbi:19578_t:CDS:1 [Cetraspora pellucida]|uniref:Fucosyltransferase n=1 Tax=Cetraspora pellucida TaxID=1433469 RepID=A0A9N8ZJ80_9GLOM|nr:19578_t:CDS:1 [Cetraspora pellucida]
MKSTILLPANELNYNVTEMNHTALIDKLQIKPTNLIEWKQRHYITNYLNNNKKVKIYISSGNWYVNEDFQRLTYKLDETLAYCDIPCIWQQKSLSSIPSTEHETVDALFNVDYAFLPEQKAWKGQKYIKLSIEPKTYGGGFDRDYESFDIHSSFDEDSDVPTSYVRFDPEKLRIIQPFNISKLSSNSTLISLIASHTTDFRSSFIPSLQVHMPVASFGLVNRNAHWDLYPECLNVKVDPKNGAILEKFETKNCVISKFPFYLSIENCQEKDYSTEKLWDTFKLGVVPVIWGAPNTRSYLPHPKSAIYIEDFPDVEALANHLKYLTTNETAYLEYHQWRTMKFSDKFEEKAYMSMRNLECNMCKEVARLRILDE